jgi:Darcynin, domain of unknown function
VPLACRGTQGQPWERPQQCPVPNERNLKGNLMTKPYTIFMLVKTTPTWLTVPPKERFTFLENDIAPILAKHREVTLRFFDVEAFNARATDVLMWETHDLTRFQSLVEHLRETPFWSTYFDVVDILPGTEDAYADHYGVKVE